MAIPDSVPEDVYPSSSEDGTPIPLATVRPIGCYSNNLVASDQLSIELPDSINLVSLYCTSRGMLFTDGVSLEPGYKAGCFIFLPDVQYELTLPRYCTLVADADSEIIINILMRWSQVRNPAAYQLS